jgi:hypothetical protein
LQKRHAVFAGGGDRTAKACDIDTGPSRGRAPFAAYVAEMRRQAYAVKVLQHRTAGQ